MEENITKIKVGDDVRCISLDAEVIDTSTIGFGGDGKLGVRLGSSVYAADDGIGVKIHPDTLNFLRREPSGLSLMLDTMGEAITPKIVNKLSLIVKPSDNTLVIDTSYSGKPLMLGTGLKSDDNGKTLFLSIGSGLEVDRTNKSIRLKIDESQGLILVQPDGFIAFDLSLLCSLLEARYNLTKK